MRVQAAGPGSPRSEAGEEDALRQAVIDAAEAWLEPKDSQRAFEEAESELEKTVKALVKFQKRRKQR